MPRAGEAGEDDEGFDAARQDAQRQTGDNGVADVVCFGGLALGLDGAVGEGGLHGSPVATWWQRISMLRHATRRVAMCQGFKGLSSGVKALGDAMRRDVTCRQVLFDNLPGSVEHIKAGSLRALGVTAGKRAAPSPDVPTIGETVPGYQAGVWDGIGAPKSPPTQVHHPPHPTA